MAIKKSQLYSSIWQGCDQLRGGMDASQYKDYVLVLLFLRYVLTGNLGMPLSKYPRVVVMYDSMCKFGGERENGEKWLSDLAEETRSRGG